MHFATRGVLRLFRLSFGVIQTTKGRKDPVTVCDLWLVVNDAVIKVIFFVEITVFVFFLSFYIFEARGHYRAVINLITQFFLLLKYSKYAIFKI